MFTWTLTNIDTVETDILLYDPKGWEEMKFVHNRSERFDGMFLDFSQQLEFYCKGGGKEFVDEAYESKGSEANVTLDLTYSCDASTATIKSKLDFSTYSEQFRGNKLYTVIDVNKVGITQLVKNRSKVDVDLLSETSIGGTALNPYPIQLINMHSKVIHLESEWLGANHGCCFRFTAAVGPGLKELYLLPAMDTIKGDFDQTNKQSTSCSFDTNFNGFLGGMPPIIDTGSSNIIIEPQTVLVTWNFTGSINFVTRDVSIAGSACDPNTCGTEAVSVKLIDQVNVRLRLFWGTPNNPVEAANDCVSPTNDGTSIQFIDILADSAGNPDIPQFVLGTNTTRGFANANSIGKEILINPGDKVWFQWVVDINLHSSDADLVVSVTYTEATLNLQSDTTYSPSIIKALPIHEALSRICEGITDQTLAFKSEFFGRVNSRGISYANNGYASFTAITDGLRIRGIEKTTDAEVEEGETKKGVITNLDDAYDSANAVWGVGLGIETHNGVEVVRVEEKTYFYSETIILTLDDVPNIQMKFDTERAYSAIELGYVKWKPELKNGLDEPLTTATWEFTKIKSFSNTLTLKSPYVAGMYAIETTRRKNIASKTTDDSNYDDDIFFIALNRLTENGLPVKLDFPERNETISASNLISPETAYNLRFNLFSNFDRLMNQFTNNLTKDQPQAINYSYFEGNGAMKFQYLEIPNHPGSLNYNEVENVHNTTYSSGIHQRNTPIFLPEQYTFSYPLEFSTYINILNNPYGKIRFSGDGTNYFEGWILTLEYQIKTGMTNFTIIRKYGT